MNFIMFLFFFFMFGYGGLCSNVILVGISVFGMLATLDGD